MLIQNRIQEAFFNANSNMHWVQMISFSFRSMNSVSVVATVLCCDCRKTVMDTTGLIYPRGSYTRICMDFV